MRQTISGMIAAIAVLAAGTCRRWRAVAIPVRTGYGGPCAPVYVGLPDRLHSCGGWGYERLPDPECSITRARASVLLCQPGPDLYRSRRFRAISGL